MSRDSLLLQVIRRPEAATEFDAVRWTRLLAEARHARLLPRLALLFDDLGIELSLPARVRAQLGGARPMAGQHERSIRWEISRIREALRRVDTTVVVLKGAAYVLAELPAARGRLASDVDILVPRRDLAAVEAALVEAGWEAVTLHPYDQRYYRQWSHELPPLQHRRRRSVLDVHHNILPVSGRLKPDAAALLERTVPLGPDGLRMLAPEDMVLHASVHLFQDGDLAGSVRDLVDVDALLRHFGQHAPGFWDRLVPRARELGLLRPAYYALRYTGRLLETPIPPAVEAAVASRRPSLPVRRLMDRLVARALLPAAPGGGTLGEETARLLLYMRSHWLRMPPWQLMTHLAHKTRRRWWAEPEE